jgi:hypothetical protein
MYNRSKQSGATLVEFALTAPLFFIVVFTSIYLVYFLYKTSALHYMSIMGTRDGVIQTFLLDALSPNTHIHNAIIAQNGKLGITLSSIRVCPVSALPACPNTAVPRGQLFMVRAEATNDVFSRFLGLEYVTWVIGVNSHPVGIQRLT